jgi:tellurite resistance protein
MFLNYLKDTNKENFLKVCVHAALSNGVFAEKEKEALAAYCREMNVEVHIPKTQEAFSDLLQSVLENTTPTERNIFVLESLALVKYDGVYDEKEQSFMSSLIKGLNVSETVLAKFVELLDKYIKIGKELYEAIVE